MRRIFRRHIRRTLSQDILPVLQEANFAFDKGEFVKGTKALEADDRVIYNQHNGKLFFDHDGTGTDAKVLFAVIEDHAKLHFGDFTYQA